MEAENRPRGADRCLCSKYDHSVTVCRVTFSKLICSFLLEPPSFGKEAFFSGMPPFAGGRLARRWCLWPKRKSADVRMCGCADVRMCGCADCGLRIADCGLRIAAGGCWNAATAGESGTGASFAPEPEKPEWTLSRAEAASGLVSRFFRRGRVLQDIGNANVY